MCFKTCECDISLCIYDLSSYFDYGNNLSWLGLMWLMWENNHKSAGANNQQLIFCLINKDAKIWPHL